VETKEKAVKVDKDKIIQEEVSATGKVFMPALFQIFQNLFLVFHIY